jgi:hypothetical protein
MAITEYTQNADRAILNTDRATHTHTNTCTNTNTYIDATLSQRQYACMCMHTPCTHQPTEMRMCVGSGFASGRQYKNLKWVWTVVC